LFHGLAHAGIGVWAAETGRWWIATSLWELGMVGFLAAGFGALGVAVLRPYWRGLTVVAAVGSFLLFLLAPSGLFVAGMAIDVMAVSLVLYSRDAAIPQDWWRLQRRVRKTLTKKQRNSDGRGRPEAAASYHGILRRKTSTSRAPHSVRAG
jgi:hypothetical protein